MAPPERHMFAPKDRLAAIDDGVKCRLTQVCCVGNSNATCSHLGDVIFQNGE